MDVNIYIWLRPGGYPPSIDWVRVTVNTTLSGVSSLQFLVAGTSSQLYKKIILGTQVLSWAAKRDLEPTEHATENE